MRNVLSMIMVLTELNYISVFNGPRFAPELQVMSHLATEKALLSPFPLAIVMEAAMDQLHVAFFCCHKLYYG